MPLDANHFSGNSLVADRFCLVDTLGQGGWGVVYKALDTHEEDKPIALKVQHANLPEHLRYYFTVEVYLAAFLAEICPAAVAGVHIEEIIRDVHAQCECIAFELLSGSSLDRIISPGPMPLQRAAAIGLSVLDALELVHDQGIIWRDLKPENIMVDGDDHAKLIDCSLAKQLDDDMSFTPHKGQDTFIGSLVWSAPERFFGKVQDFSVDMYSFGALLYCMLQGHVPFQGGTACILQHKILLNRAPRLSQSFPQDVRVLVARLMAKSSRFRPTLSQAREVLTRHVA